MPFPFYQVPFLGNGMTIGLDAVLHVIISHGFAIGLMTMIVLSEYIGWRRSDPRWEHLARDLFGLALIVIMGIGAILGAGIWLVTTALEPRGIASLLRVFFWPWFIEWFAFTGEVIVILIYYFTWKRWTSPYPAASPREHALKLRHIRFGFAYMLFSLASAVLITGILGFMLTPDGWPQGRSFISGFLNETFVPQLLLRLSAAYTLGAVFGMAYLLLSRGKAERDPAFQRSVLAIFGRVALIGALACVASTTWYFAVVPSRFKAQAIFAVLTSYASQHPGLFWFANGLGLVLLLGLALAALRRSQFLAKVLIVPVLICCVGFVTEFERIREFIRGPYIMPGYMYANQVLLSESPVFQQEGMLPNAYWYNAAAGGSPQSQGAYLFSQNCAACHTIGGINNIASRVAGRSEDGISVIIGHTSELVPFMAPFSGTPQEQRILAQYLYQVAHPAPGAAGAGSPSRFITQ